MLPDNWDDMTDAERTEWLEETGAKPSWEDMATGAAAIAAALYAIGPGDPRAAERRELIFAREQKGGLRQLSRRFQERLTTAQYLGGNPKQELIRISEGDSESCDDCIGLSGSIGTIEQHEAVGLPGGQQCMGNCRCQLARYGLA